MTRKRALVVDDSRSARAFLTRLLEKHDLDVDAAESAEVAIEYLTRHRPDVIFMDHLMPGMDGFQAVQAIKGNPRTATIPILMYTSQEGELYLGQARALGAIGVLPKQIAPADVSKVLYQLKLIPDRRSAAPAFVPLAEPVTPAEVAARAAAAAPPVPDLDDTATAERPVLPLVPEAAGVTPAADVYLRDQVAELRRYVAAALQAQGDRLAEELRTALQDALPPPPPPPEPVVVRDLRALGLAVAAVLAAVALAALLWHEGSQRRALESRLLALASPPAPAAAARADASGAAGVPLDAATMLPLPADPATAAAQGEPAPPAQDRVIVPVPYGESPFAGARVERLRTLVQDLARAGFRGRLEAQGHSGRFCLAGNAQEGFSLAQPEQPAARCDRLGNPLDDARQPRESVAFASAVIELRRAHAGSIEIVVVEMAEERPLRPYPDPATAVAADWNAAATLNNRVEFRWSARP